MATSSLSLSSGSTELPRYPGGSHRANSTLPLASSAHRLLDGIALGHTQQPKDSWLDTSDRSYYRDRRGSQSQSQSTLLLHCPPWPGHLQTAPQNLMWSWKEAAGQRWDRDWSPPHHDICHIKSAVTSKQVKANTEEPCGLDAMPLAHSPRAARPGSSPTTATQHHGLGQFTAHWHLF